MLRKDLDQVLAGLMETMDNQIKMSQDLVNKINELKDSIRTQEDHLMLMNAMMKQLQANLDADREELKRLEELAEKKQISTLYEKIDNKENNQ